MLCKLEYALVRYFHKPCILLSLCWSFICWTPRSFALQILTKNFLGQGQFLKVKLKTVSCFLMHKYQIPIYKWMFKLIMCFIIYSYFPRHEPLYSCIASIMVIRVVEFSSGGTKLEIFLPNNIPKGNCWILRIGVVASCQKLGIIFSNKAI